MKSESLFSAEELKELKQSRCLVLVSGGPDSIFLFKTFLLLRQDFGVNFGVLHVNHKLRGAESDGDESFVRGLCERSGVPCHVFALQLPKVGNLQNLARQERLRLCFELKAAHRYDLFFTAHHRDDVLETLVMRSQRGAGMKGLSGIKRRLELRHPRKKFLSLTLMRPLLALSKETILNELKQASHDYRVDSSNLTNKYFRNRIRQSLRKWDEERKSQLWTLSQTISLCDDYFQARLDFLLKHFHHFVSLKDWESWPEELQFRFFVSRMRDKGYKKQIQREHFENTRLSVTKLDLDGALFFKDESGCYFYAQSEFDSLKQHQVLVGTGSYRFGHWGQSLTIQKKEKPKDLNFAQASGWQRLLCVDARRVEFPLFLKQENLSVELAAFGDKKSVSLKALCQARRIPLHRRSFLPVLRDAKQNIVAVAGVEISADYQVRPESQEILTIKVWI